MPQRERLRVWQGDLKKTSGGLTRDNLVKNKRGKIVSRKKSGQAVGDANNLGSWLRGKGDAFTGKPKGFKVGKAPGGGDDDEKLAEVPKPKPKPKKVAPKKVVPKKVAPKKSKPKPVAKKVKAAVIDLTDSPVKAKQKKKKKKKLEPMKAGEEKDLSKISVGNILLEQQAPTKAADKIELYKSMGFTAKQIDELMKKKEPAGGALKIASQVRKLLKASKRRGKRRTKRQLLQDVLDL